MVDEIRSRTAEESRRSGLKRRCNDPGTTEQKVPKKTMKTVDEAALKALKEYVRKNRSAVVSKDEQLDILLLQGKLRYEHEERQKIMGTGRKARNAAATARVSDLLGRKKDLVAEVWSSYVNGIPLSVANPAGNYRLKSTRVPRARGVAKMVQAFVRQRRQIRQRTVAKDVMDFLDGCGFISVDRICKNDISSALRSVQRFLCRVGYKRGKKKGMKHYKLRAESILKRDTYVRFMTAVNADPARRVVYMDESYIHKNYQRNDDSLFDPNDEQDMEVKAMHKGRRYCFIAAIIDEDKSFESVPSQERPAVSKAHLMLETYDVFEGGKKQTVDYHGMFDTKYFVKWMQTLLDTLSGMGIQNAVIVMDNAKYHKTLPEGTPKSSWKKENLINYCHANNIAVNPGDLRSILWERVKVWVQEHTKSIVVNMAEEAGHTVIWSPPHHSDLQPIELVWANVKGKVGRQYTTETTFQDVKRRLDQAITELESKTVAGCIRKANLHLNDLLQHILAVEQLDEVSDEENDESSDENNSDLSD